MLTERERRAIVLWVLLSFKSGHSTVNIVDEVLGEGNTAPPPQRFREAVELLRRVGVRIDETRIGPAGRRSSTRLRERHWQIAGTESGFVELDEATRQTVAQHLASRRVTGAAGWLPALIGELPIPTAQTLHIPDGIKPLLKAEREGRLVSFEYTALDGVTKRWIPIAVHSVWPASKRWVAHLYSPSTAKSYMLDPARMQRIEPSGLVPDDSPGPDPAVPTWLWDVDEHRSVIAVDARCAGAQRIQHDYGTLEIATTNRTGLFLRLARIGAEVRLHNATDQAQFDQVAARLRPPPPDPGGRPTAEQRLSHFFDVLRYLLERPTGVRGRYSAPVAELSALTGRTETQIRTFFGGLLLHTAEPHDESLLMFEINGDRIVLDDFAGIGPIPRWVSQGTYDVLTAAGILS